jgi:hypothetical protein
VSNTPAIPARPLGVDAGQLGQARTLDDGAHAQPERRIPEQRRQTDEDDHTGDDDGDVVATHEHVVDRAIGRPAIGNDAHTVRLGVRAEPQDDHLWEGDE